MECSITESRFASSFNLYRCKMLFVTETVRTVAWELQNLIFSRPELTPGFPDQQSAKQTSLKKAA